MRIDRELRWLDREPVEGELTVTAEKLIPFHPDRSKYLDSRDFDATRERLQEEKELVDLELASPSPQAAML